MPETAIPVITAELNVQHEEPDTPTTPSAVREMPVGITGEVFAVIEAAATAFVGRKVHVLAIKMLSENEEIDSGAWASQGRDMIQSSHNLIQRGH
jgi:hypothetical protein